MRKKISVLWLGCALLVAVVGWRMYSSGNVIAQSPPPFNLQISQQPLPIVTNVFANRSGAGTGVTTNFYWVVARYGVGNASASLPIRVGNIGTGNTVSIGWSAPSSPTGYLLAYDILRTTSNVLGSSCTNCLVGSNQTTLSVTDSLGALSSYTVNTYNSSNPITLAIDNVNTSTISIVSGANFASNSTGFTGSLAGDVTGTQSATALSAVGGVNLVGLGTGIFKVNPAALAAAGDITGLIASSGNWTPVLTFGGLSTGIAYSSQLGDYYKIGNMVTIRCSFVLTSKGSATGSAVVTGVPFAASSNGGSNLLKAGAGEGSQNNLSTVNHLLLSIGASLSQVDLIDGNTGNLTLLTDTNFTNTSILRFSITYFT